jgi:hypothetical protein
MGDEPLNGASQIMRMGDAPFTNGRRVNVWRVSDHVDVRRATGWSVSDHTDGRRATGWLVSDCVVGLRHNPPWGLEVRTSCPNLQSDTLVVRLGGSGESGAGGCAAGWICHGGRWRSRGERVAAGGWSTIEPLLAVVCRGGSGKVPPT